LAAHLHLSPSRTSHAVKEFTGMSFQDLLLKERMARATILLESSGDSLAEIAAKLGFENEFYFNRAFKKACGTPPGSFRRLRLAGRV
jgi:AraC-like DNA-binding protein